MEGFVGQTCEFGHAGPVVVLFVRVLAESVGVGILVGQDARAAGVQPVAGLGAGLDARRDGFGGADVVRGVCCVCVRNRQPESLESRGLFCGGERRTMSAFAASSFKISESSSPPRTMRMFG